MILDFEEFKRRMLAQFRLNLHGYKENQLRRRIDGLLSRQKINSYADLFQLMAADRKAYEAFLDHLTINVTEFFRDPLRWLELEKKILPELLQAKGSLKIWSAACSTGAEPYSLGILLDELSPGRTHRLEATDIDKTILETARTGRYNPDAVKNVGKERLSRYFTASGSSYSIVDQLKKKVSFRRHDLLIEDYPQGYDLIVCRNVTIYFTREAQDKINRNFSRSLNQGGILFIGGSEMIFNHQELELEKVFPCFYRKKK